MSARLVKAARAALPSEEVESIAIGQARPRWAYASILVFVVVWVAARGAGWSSTAATAVAGGLGVAAFNVACTTYIVAIGRRSMHLFRPQRWKALFLLPLGDHLQPVEPGTVRRDGDGLFWVPWIIAGRRLHLPRAHSRRMDELRPWGVSSAGG